MTLALPLVRPMTMEEKLQNVCASELDSKEFGSGGLTPMCRVQCSYCMAEPHGCWPRVGRICDGWRSFILYLYLPS